MELHAVDRLNPESEVPAGCGPTTGPPDWRPRVPTLDCGPSPGLHVSTARSQGVRLATPAAIALALGVVTYGVVTNRSNVGMVGLAAACLTAVVMAVSACRSLRTAQRSCELLHRALTESERARDELHVANQRLRRRNADLRASQRAVVQGLGLIDERTRGRLWELIEEAGGELAALVDETLDGPPEAA
jgi:hypothetical protein